MRLWPVAFPWKGGHCELEFSAFWIDEGGELMTRKRFSEEQTTGDLKENEAGAQHSPTPEDSSYAWPQSRGRSQSPRPDHSPAFETAS